MSLLANQAVSRIEPTRETAASALAVFFPAAEAKPSPVAGLIFDVANVLYDATLWRRWLLRLLNQLGVWAEYDEFYRSWDCDYLADVHCGRREYGEAFQAFLLASGLSWAQVDEIEAASRTQHRNLELNARPFPGVVATVSQLCQWELPLVAWADTPFTAATLTERIEQLSLGNCFQAVFSSFDQECLQNSPRCYQTALETLGVPAAQTVYVGHDAENLAVAKTLGLQTIAFNYQPHAQADQFLTRFENLLAFVRKGAVSPRSQTALSRAAAMRSHSMLLVK